MDKNEDFGRVVRVKRHQKWWLKQSPQRLLFFRSEGLHFKNKFTWLGASLFQK
jgi:hypothetical protein